tara:strand:+ start:1183 stop:1389 length:207 start_codon:yes stop_codon:yes gene_type:complete
MDASRMFLIVCASLSASSLFFTHLCTNQEILSIIFINDFNSFKSFFVPSQKKASQIRLKKLILLTRNN